jgi:hypothetical protein
MRTWGSKGVGSQLTYQCQLTPDPFALAIVRQFCGRWRHEGRRNLRKKASRRTPTAPRPRQDRHLLVPPVNSLSMN